MPGPRAILYFLQHDADLRAAGLAPPRSTATVWRVLEQHGRIPRRLAGPGRRRAYTRTVRAHGDVVVEHARYYVGQRLAGQRVAVAVAADEWALVVRHRCAVLKRLPLRGLHGARQPFERYLALMEQEARAEARRGRARMIRRAA